MTLTSNLIDGNNGDFVALSHHGSSMIVQLFGDWTIDHAALIDHQMPKIIEAAKGGAVVDCAGVRKMDTTGAVLIRRYAKLLDDAGAAILTGVPRQHKNLLLVVDRCPPPTPIMPDQVHWFKRLVGDLGENTEEIVFSVGSMLSFFGSVLLRLLALVKYPMRLSYTALAFQIEAVGVRSMGIVGLISFLIGAVMVNQGAIQLAKFGADIFVIDMLGITHLREMGVLLTSIIIAGRSGSAFTAQIGSMKLYEEIDAMKTIGLHPVDVLVLPRLMTLTIALPLLVFYADMFGMIGGAMMAWVQLDISPANFIYYFRDVVSLDHFLVGILKAPVFAGIIAICGCYHGLNVKGSADSLGRRTTRSVVQAIFLVIIFDAFFAVFFTALDM